MKTKQTKEFSEQGRVKKDIYIEYAKASNLGAVCVYLVMLLGAQSAQIGTYHTVTLRDRPVCPEKLGRGGKTA
jgi:hypothetical protein